MICLHGDWSLITDDEGLPIMIVCGQCGDDREVTVRWTYDDVMRREERRLHSA